MIEAEPDPEKQQASEEIGTQAKKPAKKGTEELGPPPNLPGKGTKAVQVDPKMSHMIRQRRIDALTSGSAWNRRPGIGD